jgi:hypothetical protein
MQPLDCASEQFDLIPCAFHPRNPARQKTLVCTSMRSPTVTGHRGLG